MSIITDGDVLVKSMSQLALTTGATERQLPTRPDYGRLGHSTWVRANFFPVQLPHSTIFLYEVSFTPSITINGIKRRVHELLRQHPAIAAFEKHSATDGSQYLVSSKQLNPRTSPTKEGRDDDKVSVQIVDDRQKYQVDIERRAKILPSDLIDYLNGKSPNYDPGQAIQALNIFLAKFPRDQIRIVPVSGNRFFLVSQRNDLQFELGCGLVARKGFYSSIRPTIGRMLVNFNVCTKAFYKTGPLVALISMFIGKPEGQVSPQSISRLKSFLLGLKVSDTYGANGKRRIRTIQDLGSRPQDIKLEKKSLSTGSITATDVASYFKAGVVTTYKVL
jgi:eukaryotic translation initiation factor 2C